MNRAFRVGLEIAGWGLLVAIGPLVLWLWLLALYVVALIIGGG